MDKKELDKLLFEMTDQEQLYTASENSSSPRFAYARKVSINGNDTMYFHLDNLDASKIILRKDSRFLAMPPYTYSSININFIYSGDCTYWIDGQELILHQGDICIFDKGIVRSKKKPGYNDIIININISDHHFRKSIPEFENQNIISSFLLGHLLGNSDHANYIVFRTQGDKRILDLFDRLLIEYYENRPYAKEKMQNYLSIIIMELLLLYQTKKDIHSVHLSSDNYNRALEILYYIENHYTSCTLKDVADHFGYHQKYLCAYIKRHIGKTFQEIKREYRLKEACSYLLNTTLSIQDISEKTGYTNRSQFYKEFKEKYAMLPAEYRKKDANLVQTF